MFLEHAYITFIFALDLQIDRNEKKKLIVIQRKKGEKKK